MSHKCTELDKQLPQLLGVSRAILEHVVFCHQEESSWPLMEGAVLKKRFDDIFDSTKYTKALHIFRQTEKERDDPQYGDSVCGPTGFSAHCHQTARLTAKRRIPVSYRATQRVARRHRAAICHQCRKHPQTQWCRYAQSRYAPENQGVLRLLAVLKVIKNY